jgi:hypothetical protein
VAVIGVAFPLLEGFVTIFEIIVSLSYLDKILGYKE